MKDLKNVKDTRHQDCWITGNFGAWEFSAKVYDEPSEFGINEGRVSKLWIAKRLPNGKVNSEIAVYERGWEVKPRAHQINGYTKLLKYLESLPTVFS